MKKMLVTGASGFLGRRIVQHYKAYYDVYTPSSKELNITDKDAVFKVWKDIRPQVVIHCAAVSDVGECERNPETSYLINVDGSRNVAEISGKVGAKCLLCSSDQVYVGSTLAGAHKESELLLPENTYGREKLTAEKQCLQVNPESVMLRLSWMYDTCSMGEKKNSDFVRGFLEKYEKKEPLIYPVNDIRGITYVREVAANLENAFELPGGVYNFGALNDKNTYETVRELLRELGWNSDMLQMNTNAFADSPRNISMDQEKLNGEGIWFTSTSDRLVEIFRKM